MSRKVEGKSISYILLLCLKRIYFLVKNLRKRFKKVLEIKDNEEKISVE
jgi:hypothetical protein